mmetsp:Transcript_76/g.153  ORF Transcript_76/g.153 Transcript_76/m.153 type:complete len:322 (+) Transcript_76:92-1057(+)
MKAHGTKIKIGISSAGTTTTNRPEAATAASLAKSRAAHSTPLDTPCPAATIFELCKTKNDPSFHKKRKAKSKDRDGGDTTASRVGAGSTKEQADATSTAKKVSSVSANRSGTGQDAASALGPQVEIVNGKIVLRESSLMVPVHGPVTHEDFEEVEEGIHPTAKYSSFTKHVHSYAWGLEETKHFYEALRQCGTDFTLMQAFFPHRTRKQLKLKFSREEKQHPELVKGTLNSQLPLDLAPFEVHLGSIMESAPAMKKQKLSGVAGDSGGEGGSDDDDDEDGGAVATRSRSSRRPKPVPATRRTTSQPSAGDVATPAGGLVDV